jgi:hypothetical protein
MSCEEEGGNLEPQKANGFHFIDTTELIGSINLQFPLITDPVFIPVQSANFLEKSDNVYIYQQNSQTFIYPVKSLYVEVINQQLPEQPIAMTYCPITGSGFATSRVIEGDTLLFRASGMRYKENLMPLDNTNESVWSQMLIKCVRGKYVGKTLKALPILETNWSVAKKNYPQGQVLSINPDSKSGYNNTIQYKNSPGPGDDNNDEDASIRDNSKVFGVLESGRPIVAEYGDFPADSIKLKKHASSKTLFVGSRSPRFIMAFKASLNKEFFPVQDQLPIVMKDEQGNYYNWFGTVVKGPSHGEKLDIPNYYTAYWWAWKDFFNGFIHIK